MLILSPRAEREKSRDWHRPFLPPCGILRNPLAWRGFLWQVGGSEALSSQKPTLTRWEVQGWHLSLHSPFVSLAGVKKRTKVIKNSVNPVWNEVGKLSVLPPFRSAATVSAMTSWGLGQEVAFPVSLSRRGRAAGPVCQRSLPGARNLGGGLVAWPAG